jgi:hypothetical protein
MIKRLTTNFNLVANLFLIKKRKDINSGMGCKYLGVIQGVRGFPLQFLLHTPNRIGWDATSIPHAPLLKHGKLISSFNPS